MFKYEVGQIIPEFVNHREEPYFDMDDNGATMIVVFDSPTQNEINQFESGKEFQIKFIELYDVIFITAKIGNLEWIDAPYSPHLSLNLTKFPIPNNGQGLGLTLMLVDGKTGKLENIRLIGLSEDFSRKLIGTVIDNREKPFEQTRYDATIFKVYSRYSSKKLANMSKDRCRIN